MKNLISCFLFLLISVTVFAQENTVFNQAKFNLIKNAVWFYSTDVKTFGPQADCSDSKDYSKLIDCTKGMKGVGDNIKEWEKRKISSLEDLKSFKKEIEGKVVTTKNKRRELEGHDAFTNNAEIIIAKVPDNANADKEGKDAELLTDSLDARGVGPTTQPKGIVSGEPEATSDSGFNMWLLIPIILSLIALGYAMLSNKGLKEDLANLKRARKASDSSENSSAEHRINSLEKSLKSFDTSIEELKEDFNKKIKKISNAESTNQISSIVDIPLKDPKPSSTSRFAKYADLGDGFSTNQLAEEQDNEKIFELVVMDNNKARFKVVTNKKAQLLALSNPNLYLNKTCTYDSVPTATSNIITEAEGDLKLQGNKWLIVNPTSISFE